MTNKRFLLSMVTDANLKNHIHSKVAPILDEKIRFNLSWLRQKNWVAIPVIFSILPRDASQITEVIISSTINMCYSVWVRPRAMLETFYLPISTKNIMAMGGESHVYPMLMLPIDGSFMILSKGDPDYHVIAGKEDFVLKCLSFSVSETKSRFESEANLEEPIRQKILLDVLDYYDEYIKSF